MSDRPVLDFGRLAAEPHSPLRDSQPATWRLLRNLPLYARGDEGDAIFAEAMRENTLWHFERNEAYRRYCGTCRFDPARDLRDLPDTARIPPLAADLFRYFDLATRRGPELHTISSSGTTGRPTRLPLDDETVIRMWAMGHATFREEGLAGDVPAHYLVFAPDPASSPGSGNAHFFKALMEFAPPRKVVFALDSEKQGGFRLNLERAGGLLDLGGRHGEPVRILGLPALIAEAARRLGGDSVRLDPESLVLTGGGWKGREAAKMTKAAFRELVGESWGVAPERIRDLYGMTEHAVHYLECEGHRFHPPVFSRVRVVDPLSRLDTAEGEEGVIVLLNPGFTTMPLQSLLTADVGRRVSCSCGRGTPAFEVLRRGGRPGHRGCAAAIGERVTP